MIGPRLVIVHQDHERVRRPLYEHRRADCARLPACEEAFLAARVARGEPIVWQARCPRVCRYFEARA